MSLPTDWRTGRLRWIAPVFRQTGFAGQREAASRWWAGRTAWERLLLAIGCAVLLAAAYFLLVWRPLAAARDARLMHVASLENLIATARGLDPATLAVPQRKPDAPATAVTSAAAEFGLVIRRVETEGVQTRVVLEDVKFQAVLAWLTRLDRDFDLRPSSVELDRRPEPAIVTARITLE